jgi:L-amino acid N-acyltransferase YncA
VVSKNLSHILDCGGSFVTGISPRIFVAKDGRKVTVRPIRWEDLDDCIEFINSLIDEGAEIAVETRVSRNEEADWLGKRLASAEKGEFVDIIAEIDGKMIANAEVGRRTGPMSHVGDLGIGIRAEYRGIGVGTMLMKTLVDESRKMGLKMLVLDVFDTNKTAKGLYKKIGFRENGRIPKGVFKKGEYIDLVRMTLEL